MRPWKLRTALLVTAVLSLAAPAIAANAAPSHLAPGSIVRAAAHPAAAGVNAFLASDVAFEVKEPGATFVAAEGRLTLKKVSDQTYRGTFVDDFASGKVFAASATHAWATVDHGLFVIATHAGTFRVNLGTSARKVTAPASFGSGVAAAVSYNPHTYTAQAPLTLTMHSTFGTYFPAASGLLTVTTDSLGYIAPYNAALHLAGSYVYTSGTSTTKHLSRITSSGRYRAPNCSGGGVLSLALPRGTSTWHIDAVEKDAAGGPCSLVAKAFTGSGTSYGVASVIGQL